MIIDPQVIERLCRMNDITTLRIFGSAARDEDAEGSDVDLLAEFRNPVSLMDLVGVEQAFEDELGRKVDLLTPRGLSPHIRDRVIAESKVLYARPER